MKSEWIPTWNSLSEFHDTLNGRSGKMSHALPHNDFLLFQQICAPHRIVLVHCTSLQGLQKPSTPSLRYPIYHQRIHYLAFWVLYNYVYFQKQFSPVEIMSSR